MRVHFSVVSDAPKLSDATISWQEKFFGLASHFAVSKERLHAQHYLGVFKTHTFGILDAIDVIRAYISLWTFEPTGIIPNMKVR